MGWLNYNYPNVHPTDLQKSALSLETGFGNFMLMDLILYRLTIAQVNNWFVASHMSSIHTQVYQRTSKISQKL